MKFAPKWQTAALALAVAGVVGCDPVSNSNKDVISQMNDGHAKLAKADGYKPVDAVTAAHTSFTAAAGNKGASVGFQAVSAASVGFLDQGLGQTSAAPFFQNIVAARQSLVELRQLAVQVSLNNSLAAGNKKADPKDAQAKLAAQITAMQGNAQAASWGGDSAKLPTLAAVKQEESRLQGEIAQHTQQLADLTKQRSDAIATSETQLKHADSLKGDEAVRAFADGSESRRKADDLGIQIDLEQDKLSRAQSDLGIQQGQETAVNAGIALLQGQSKQLDTGWTDAQTHAANQNKIAAIAVLGDDADKANKQSMKEISALLKTQLDAVTASRNDARNQLEEAEKFYLTAQTQSQNLIKSFADKIIATSKESKNYTSLKLTMHPSQYALQIGVVRRDSATLIAAEAALQNEANATKTLVAAALEPAGQQVPAELAAIDPATAKSLSDEAASRLTAAMDMLTTVESGDAPPTVKNAAKVAHLVALGATIQLDGLKSTLGDPAAKDAATAALADAQTLKADIIAAGLPLPALPGDLGVPPPPPAPAAAPTPAPADAPPTPSSPAPTPGEPAPAAAG